MAKRTRKQQARPQRLILDSGAVIALSRNDVRARAALAAALANGRAAPMLCSAIQASTSSGSNRIRCPT